jgi:hypothetical protein
MAAVDQNEASDTGPDEKARGAAPEAATAHD